jgi:hypothetical protein
MRDGPAEPQKDPGQNGRPGFSRRRNGASASPPPWRKVTRLYLLLARVRWIDMRLNLLYRGGRSPRGEKLLPLMEQWLAAHEAAAVILRRPLPPHVEQVRAILRGLGSQHPRSPDPVC